jgi:hypothetical protein
MRFSLPFLFLVGCGASIAATPINPAPRLVVRTPAEVEMFVSRVPLRPHIDVAVLEIQKRRDDTPTALAKVRERAAAMGCDAVVINGPDNRVYGDRFYTSTTEGFFGTCIAYTDVR